MFERNLVIFNQKPLTDKWAVIEDLARQASHKVNDVDVYIDAVKQREQGIPTYIEYGVAIPHGKTDAVNEAFVAYEKLASPVVWGNENEKAEYVFLIGVPQKQAGNLHLKIISELSKNLMREDFRNQLLNAKTEDEVYQLLMIVERGILK